jgi:hypothetical protein
MEYYAGADVAAAQLFWSSASTAKAVIPQARLFSTAPPPPPSLSISDASVAEGNSGAKNLAFTVTLSPPSPQTVTVNYATTDGTATAPADYTAVSTTPLSFAPGETSKVVSVSVIGETDVESNETFFVNLTSPTNAPLGDAQGQGTILDDDNIPGDGLTGRYFPNKTLTEPGQNRVDPTVNFDYGLDSPGFGGLGVNRFSIRWTGQVQPLFTETYTFCTRTDDGARLWVNNQLLVDKWVDQDLTEWCGAISLLAGSKYNITMEYYAGADVAAAQLFWSSASTAKAVIPQARLFSTAPVP